jgi:hypothetical protein
MGNEPQQEKSQGKKLERLQEGTVPPKIIVPDEQKGIVPPTIIRPSTEAVPPPAASQRPEKVPPTAPSSQLSST